MDKYDAMLNYLGFFDTENNNNKGEIHMNEKTININLENVTKEQALNIIENAYEEGSFKPYLMDRFFNWHSGYGYIGDKANFKALFGEELYVGDVVEIWCVYDEVSENQGKEFICNKDDFFVMGLASCKFNNGVSKDGKWQIRKVKSYKDLVDGELHGCIKAILK